MAQYPRQSSNNVMYSSNQGKNENKFVHTSNRSSPDYLVWANIDLFNLSCHNDKNPLKCTTRTELQVEAVDYGLDELNCHKGLHSYRRLWDTLRKSKKGTSPEFMQRELRKTSYHFFHSGSKKTIYSTKLAKEMITEIAAGTRMDLGSITSMAETFGYKKFYDIFIELKQQIIRPIVYEKIIKEIEEFDKFIRAEQINVLLNMADDIDIDDTIPGFYTIVAVLP